MRDPLREAEGRARRIEAALGRARDAARTPSYSGAARASIARPRRLAMGDPQAPLQTALRILALQGALGDDGWLDTNVHLVSMGDHFDWGPPNARSSVAQDGLGFLAWLAAHPPDQVTLVLGNHDLGRVGEMVRFDAGRFRTAQQEADAIYDEDRADPAEERRFAERYPDLPGVEVAARDFSSFHPDQRTLVASLLRAHRFSVAVAPSPRLLLCHAGVTSDDLEAVGLSSSMRSDAFVVAGTLNAALDAAETAWDGESPFVVPHLHHPGNARDGEGRGIFYQRPGDPSREPADLYEGPPRRRFDPRRLPVGLTQAIGHIRDGKCRRLLAGWANPEPTVDGPLRHLRTDGRTVRYARGLPTQDPATATVLFLDGGMAHGDPDRYELLDLVTGVTAARP